MSQSSPSKTFPPKVEAALGALRRGEFIILVDSEDRENEGDLVLAAQFATPEKVNFLIRQACGLVCLALEAEQVDRLGLPLMVSKNQSPRSTAFTVSIEAAHGVTTGISAADRAHTIQVASNPQSNFKDVVSPGHIFPLRAVPGGVRARAGHTEGSIELCKLAGLPPAAVICEIINEDGTMARRSDLERFSQRFGIPVVSIEELIESLGPVESAEAAVSKETPPLLESPWAKLPTRDAVWKVRSFRNVESGVEHLWMATHPEVAVDSKNLNSAPLVRLHSECLTGDSLGSLRCDCGSQLRLAQEKILAAQIGGALLYLRNHEGRGIGLFQKVCAYALQDQGLDTVQANEAMGFQADARSYDDAAQMLKQMGWNQIRLLTNNPAKVQALVSRGIEVLDRVPLRSGRTPDNEYYLQTKQFKFNHDLGVDS